MDAEDQNAVTIAGAPSPVGSAASPTPSVLAVMVAHNPGAWFEESLECLVAQDYPRLSILVIDTGTESDFESRVHETAPNARIIAGEVTDRGFGAAANRVLTVNPRASLVMFLHDDCALAPDAVTHLVEEVIRSNAAVVGPKLVDWDDPGRLQHVGLTVDKFGMWAALADEGEIDQSQRDSVSDVFALPSACVMIRTDLFKTIGGFDEVMRFRGDDVDLCWRAQIAGARVMVVPDAVARHREKLSDRSIVDQTRRLRVRHATRSMLSCWGLARLVRVVPQAVALTVIEVLYALVHGRLRHARELISGWTWNLRRIGNIRARRREIAGYRQVADRDLHRLQVRGSARLKMYFRGQLGREDDRMLSISAAGRDFAASMRTASTRNAAIGIVLLVVVFLAGSRHLLTRPIPAVGELQLLGGSTREIFNEWWNGWQTRAMGTDAAAPTAYGLLGIFGIPVLGHAGLLRALLILLPVPVGAIGMWRLTQPFGSRRADMAGVAVYMAAPVAYNGYSQGSLSTLVVYAASPWMLGGFARLIGTAPFAPRGRRGGSLQHRALGLGLLVTLVVAFVPFTMALVVVVASGMFLGALVVGDGRGSMRLVAGSVVALVVAFALHLPWSWTFVSGDGGRWAAFARPGDTAEGTLSTSDLLRFHVGPFGGSLLAYALVISAAFALLVARDVRLGWAVRGWFVALMSWALVWTAQQGWLPRALPDPGVVLAPAAAGLALSAALGVAAFEFDLRQHRFGWRQLVPIASGLSIVVLMLPLLVGSEDGRWKMPRRDFSRTYEGLVASPDDGAPRLLWLGEPATLPVAGYDLGTGALSDIADGVAFATTDGRAPTMLDAWATPETEGIKEVRAAMTAAALGDTNRLGRLLAVYGIRYVMITDHLAPSPINSTFRPVPGELVRTLDVQLDLERIESANENVTIFRNNSWSPIRAFIPDAIDLSADSFGAARSTDADLVDSSPALVDDGSSGVGASGRVTADDRLYVSSNASDRWELSVDGQSVPAIDAFGWAQAYEIPTSGDATLDWSTPWTRRAMLIGQVMLWVLALMRLNTLRERRRAS